MAEGDPDLPPLEEKSPPPELPEVTNGPFVRCTNCGAQAFFTLGDTVNVVNYCPEDLPAHFAADAAAGKYPLVVR